jgi:hypothetical protein
MSTVSSFLFTARGVLGTVRELARYEFRVCWALLMPKAILAARVVAAESQLAVALNTPSSRRRQRGTPPPPFVSSGSRSPGSLRAGRNWRI